MHCVAGSGAGATVVIPPKPQLSPVPEDGSGHRLVTMAQQMTPVRHSAGMVCQGSLLRDEDCMPSSLGAPPTSPITSTGTVDEKTREDHSCPDYHMLTPDAANLGSDGGSALRAAVPGSATASALAKEWHSRWTAESEDAIVKLRKESVECESHNRERTSRPPSRSETRLSHCQLAALRSAEMLWREELATSQMREAGLRVEVEAARRELAEYRWNVLVYEGSSDLSQCEADEAADSARQPGNVLQTLEMAAPDGCNCHPCAFLENRLAAVKEQVANLQDEVATSSGSETTWLEEVARLTRQAEIAELRETAERAELAESRSRREANEALSEEAALRAQVKLLSSELTAVTVYEAETVSDLQTRLTLMSREEAYCRKEMSASQLLAAMLRSEVQTAYHEASQVEVRWRQEFQAEKARWRDEWNASTTAASTPATARTVTISDAPQAKPCTSAGVGTDIPSSARAPSADTPVIVSDCGPVVRQMRSNGSIPLGDGMAVTPRHRSPSPQRLVAPTPCSQSRSSSVERRASATSVLQSARHTSVTPPPGWQSRSSSAERKVVPPAKLQSTVRSSGAPPPSRTPPVDFAAVPFAPWGMSTEAVPLVAAAARFLPAPRQSAVAPASPKRVQQVRLSGGSANRQFLTQPLQRMSSAPLLRHVPQAWPKSPMKRPSDR